MATPMTPDQMVAQFKKYGLTVKGYKSWRTHSRDKATGKTFGPVNGVMIHHTVTSGTDASVLLCYNGYSGLPGPLCHGVIAKDGTVWMVGTGRTNHAGGGDPRVLNQVIREDYDLRPVPPNVGNRDGTDGNDHFYGFECINRGDGKDPWPDAQLEAIELVSAAIIDFHGWTEKSVIGHSEWSNDKIDPRGFAMPWMRSRIKNRIGNPDTTPTPGDDMRLSDEDVERIAQRVWEKDHFIDVPWGTETNREWMPKSILVDNGKLLRELMSKLNAQSAKLDELTKVLDEHHNSTDHGTFPVKVTGTVNLNVNE